MQRDERRRHPYPLYALRRPDGDARPRSRHAVDPRPVLGLQQMRPPLLDHLPATQPRKAEAGHRTGLLKCPITFLTTPTTTSTTTKTTIPRTTTRKATTKTRTTKRSRPGKCPNRYRSPKGRPVLDFGC